MKQTAVEYLIKNLEILNLIKEGDLENELFRQLELDAKGMEKEQIIDFANDLLEVNKINWNASSISAEQYYNETFKKK
jgi:hypothetical protein